VISFKDSIYKLVTKSDLFMTRKILQALIYKRPQILHFSAANCNLKHGQTTILIWNALNAEKVILMEGNIEKDVTNLNHLLLSPTKDTIYRLIVSSKGNHFSIEKAIEIIVCQEVKIEHFIVDKDYIVESMKVNLQWNVRNATRVFIQPGNIDVSRQSSIELHPTTNTVYLLQASNDLFSAEKRLSVFVMPLPRFDAQLIPHLNTSHFSMLNVNFESLYPVNPELSVTNEISILSDNNQEQVLKPMQQSKMMRMLSRIEQFTKIGNRYV
jgi:hypothetical protein